MIREKMVAQAQRLRRPTMGGGPCRDRQDGVERGGGAERWGGEVGWEPEGREEGWTGRAERRGGGMGWGPEGREEEWRGWVERRGGWRGGWRGRAGRDVRRGQRGRA